MGNCISSSSESPPLPNIPPETVTKDVTEATPPSESNLNSRPESSAISIPKTFKLKDLEKRTDKFSNRYLLGEGVFGKVYRGKLVGKDGVQKFVAIKRMSNPNPELKQEWTAEIMTLGRLSHTNLVVLEGFCVDENEHILVYEYMPNGSVDYHLFQDWRAGTNIPPLTWQQRFKIALHASRGLTYLHLSEVIHRDFRSSNILLDENFNGKLSDFGLAKNTLGLTHVTTGLSQRSDGYICPKFQETGYATKRVDVYAFGMVLLELITGKRAKEVGKSGEPIRLLDWAGPIMAASKPDFRKLIDPFLPEPFPSDLIGPLVRCVRVCINVDPLMRPGMNDIMKTLEALNKRFFGENE